MSFPSSATLKPEPFKVKIAEEKVVELKALLKSAKLPKATYETKLETREYGVTGSWMEKALPYWRDIYDWSKSEERINQFPHYKVAIPDAKGFDYSIHFIAVLNKDPNAIPLMLLHGWPGSFAEFLALIPLLAESTSPAFHLIVPSLPGFGFSSGPPLDRDIEPLKDVSYLMNKLMTGLGFSSYASQGGDLGSFISRALAQTYPESCKAYHVNMAITSPPEGYDFAKAPEKDKVILARGKKWQENGQAYGNAHGTRTSTITHVITSSPVAMFAWIGEKWLEWTDKDPSLNTICENISIYWLTETYGTTLYFYRAFSKGGVSARPGHTGEVPFGYSLFPKEIFPVPKSWAANFGNLQYFKEHDNGGHFPATELPEVLAQDLIECFGQIYKADPNGKL